MSNQRKKQTNIDIWIVFAFCIVVFIVEFAPIPFSLDARRNTWIKSVVGQTGGFIAVMIVMRRLKLRLFAWKKGLLFLLPALLVAVNNFPFYSYFQGNMYFTHATVENIIWFALYCLAVGLFEECVFRGIVFSVIARRCSRDKRGLVKTFFISSVVFGISHIFNAFGGNLGGALLQVVYSTLTGGLFAFVLLKTRNLIYCGMVHALYNFCGLLLSVNGLGAGIVFDFWTTVIMFIVSLCVAVFVFISLKRYKQYEMDDLYGAIGV